MALIHHVVAGSGSPPIVFVHGFGCSYRDWLAQIKLAEAELERNENAFKKGAAPKTDLDKAKALLEARRTECARPDTH